METGCWGAGLNDEEAFAHVALVHHAVPRGDSARVQRLPGATKGTREGERARTSESARATHARVKVSRVDTLRANTQMHRVWAHIYTHSEPDLSESC